MSNDPRYLLVLSTCPDQSSARHIAEIVVTEKRAACVNIVPGITSCFFWEGKMDTEDELLLVMKTTSENYPALETLIKDEHPYELPEIIAVPIRTGLSGYLDWIVSNTQ